MNLPNKITVARVIIIPIFLLFMIVPFDFGTWVILEQKLPVSHLIGALIFMFASATDWIDGYLARKHGLVTNFGKFLDPLADKLLVSAALIVLVELTLLPSWIVIVIISREFAVTGLRLLLAGGGEVVAANSLGKIKTMTQMIGISILLLHNAPFQTIGLPVGLWMMWVAAIFTIWSGIDYFQKNKHVFSNE